MKKFKITTITAIAIYAMLVVVFLVGCSNETPKKKEKKYTLTVCNGHGLGAGSSSIFCDSFKMLSTKECVFWKDGQQMNIKCDNVIYPNSN